MYVSVHMCCVLNGGGTCICSSWPSNLCGPEDLGYWHNWNITTPIHQCCEVGNASFFLFIKTKCHALKYKKRFLALVFEIHFLRGWMLKHWWHSLLQKYFSEKLPKTPIYLLPLPECLQIQEGLYHLYHLVVLECLFKRIEYVCVYKQTNKHGYVCVYYTYTHRHTHKTHTQI